MSNKIMFSCNDIDNIISMHMNGLIDREIAERIGVSRGTIGRVLRRAGIKDRHPRLDNQRKLDICKLYLSGKNKREISDEMHVSTSTINRVLDSEGIAHRSSSEEHMKYKLNKEYFDAIDSHDKAYIFGLLCADGTIAPNRNSISISLQDTDVHILNEICEKIGTNKPLYRIEPRVETHKPQYMLTIVNEHMHDSLIANGMTPRKSYSFSFPKILDVEYYSSFMRGYSDGDGTINKNECRYSLILTKEFGEYLKQYLESNLKIHCGLNRAKKNSISYVLRISGRKQVKKYLDWLYSSGDMRLERKYNIYKKTYYPNSSY